MSKDRNKISYREALSLVGEVRDRCRRDSENRDLDLDIRQEHRCVFEALDNILRRVEFTE